MDRKSRSNKSEEWNATAKAEGPRHLMDNAGFWDASKIGESGFTLFLACHSD